MNRRAAFHILAYVALFVFFTFLFVLINYPSERLADQVNGYLLEATEGSITVGSARIKPPRSLELGGITLEMDQGGSLNLGRAVVSLRILALLAGNKGAEVRLENPWLDSDLSFVSTGEDWDIDVRSAEIDLSELPEEILTLPLSLTGKIGLSFNLRSSDPAKGISSGEIDVTSGPIEIGGDLLEALNLAPLRISRAAAVATIKDNILTLGENSIEGDLAASARGVIRIAFVDYTASRLDLTVELKPGPSSRDRLLPVFKLMDAKPKPDGSINMRVRGTVGRPSITM